MSGLERLYNAQLAGRAPAQLVVSERVIARSTARPGTTIHTTIEPALEELAVSRLGAREGAIAVIQPSTGAVLALAVIALSAAQPPGSTFKIITATAALDAGLVTPQTTFAVQTGAVIEGYLLDNANREACGGTLTQAFAVSCNSVFASLGARIGAARLVAEARAFGFDDPVRRLPSLPVLTRRVTSSRTAGEVQGMMLAVARAGTATAVRIPGVPIAAKTGTAELHNSNGLETNPRNDDAGWSRSPRSPPRRWPSGSCSLAPARGVAARRRSPGRSCSAHSPLPG